MDKGALTNVCCLQRKRDSGWEVGTQSFPLIRGGIKNRVQKAGKGARF
jgi:hypothetical protein